MVVTQEVSQVFGHGRKLKSEVPGAEQKGDIPNCEFSNLENFPTTEGGYPSGFHCRSLSRSSQLLRIQLLGVDGYHDSIAGWTPRLLLGKVEPPILLKLLSEAVGVADILIFHSS